VARFEPIGLEQLGAVMFLDEFFRSGGHHWRQDQVGQASLRSNFVNELFKRGPTRAVRRQSTRPRGYMCNRLDQFRCQDPMVLCTFLGNERLDRSAEARLIAVGAGAHKS